MGTIADKLSYLNETKTQFREKLNKLGADILDNVTFRSYLIYLNNLYNGLFNLTDMSKNGIVGRTSQEDTPTPTTPQEIEDLSGDITYSVNGKNILKFDNANNPSRSLYTYTTEREDLIVCTKNATGNDFYAQFITYLESGETYTLSVDDDTNRNIYMYSDRLWGTTINDLANKNAKKGTPFTFTSSYTGKAVIGFFGGGSQTLTKPMLEKETTATTYEPYIGQDYPIYLGVENYLPNNATTQTINGITYTINDDKSITINGTASGRADLWLYGSITDTGNYVFIPKGNYTMNTANLNDGTMFLSFREKTAGVRYMTRQNNGLLDLLAQQDCYFYGIMLGVESGKTINNLTFYPQIEKGTKLNSYTPYGTTPIELCKIGTYQDKIYAKDNKFYLHKEIGKFTYNNEGSVNSPATNYYNISGLGNQGWINTLGTNTYLSNEYLSTNVQNTDANFQTDTANMDYAFGIHSNGTTIRFKDSRGLSASDFKTDLIGTEIYFALSTSSTTEITSTSYPTLYNQLKEIQDYLIKYKSKYELILNYDKPNIKY